MKKDIFKRLLICILAVGMILSDTGVVRATELKEAVEQMEESEADNTEDVSESEKEEEPEQEEEKSDQIPEQTEAEKSEQIPEQNEEEKTEQVPEQNEEEKIEQPAQTLEQIEEKKPLQTPDLIQETVPDKVETSVVEPVQSKANEAEIMPLQESVEETEVLDIAEPKARQMERAGIEEGIYKIASAFNDSLVLNVDGGSIQNGANIQLYTANNSEAQQFYIRHLGNRTYILISVVSGRVLEVENGQNHDGTNVCQNAYNGSSSQKWWLSCDEDGYYTFVSEATGKVLDVSGGQARKGTNIQQYTSNGTKAQKFSVQECSTKQVSEGTYTLQSALAAGKVLDVSGANRSDGANVQLYQANGSSAQNFQVKYNGDGTWSFLAEHSKKALDISGNGYQNETNIQQYSSNGTAAQKWILKDAGNGYFALLSASNGKALDICGGSSENGANVQIYEYNGSAAQKFRFQKGRTGVTEGVYTLVSGIAANKVLDVSGGSIDNKANVQLYESNGSDAQKFYIHDVGNKNYILISTASGKVLEVEDERSHDGANVCQRAYNGSDYQKWWLTDEGNGYYTFISVATGKVLDVSGGSSRNGANIQQYASNGSNAQKFLLRSCNEKKLQEGVYAIRPALTGDKVLDISEANKGNGANAQIWQMNGSSAQNFRIKYNGDGTYTFLAEHSGKALDISGGSWENGTNVQQYDSNGTAAQKWLVRSTGDGYYAFFSVSSGKALDIDGGRTENGANVQIYEYNGSAAQKVCLQKNLVGIADGVYTLSLSFAQNKVVDVAGASISDGANIQLYASNGSDAQKFYIRNVGNHHYILISLTSGRVLEVESGNRNDGANVRQNAYNGSDYQKWQLICDENNYYTFISAATGKALDVSGGSSSNGANLQQYTMNGSGAQKFILKNTSQKKIAENTYNLRSSLAEGKVLDVSGASRGNGANVQLYQMNGTTAQSFRAKYNGDGTYTFLAEHSGKALDVDGGSCRDGANVQQYDSNGTAAQKWLLREAGNGYYSLISAANGKVLDISGGSTANGANAQIYRYNGSAAQKFELAAGTYAMDYPGLSENEKLHLDLCEGSSYNGSKMNVTLRAGRSARVESLSKEFYIVLLNSSSTKVLDARKASLSLGDSFSVSAEFTSGDQFASAMTGKYAVAVKVGQNYRLVSDTRFLDNPDITASKDAAFKDRYFGYYEGYKITSKKGIQGVSEAYTEDLRVQHVLLNVDIADMVSTSAKSGYVPYVYKGKTYYFQDLIALKKTVYDLHGWGSSEGNRYGENHMRAVTFNLLLGWKDELSYLIHPSARIKGAAPYYALNMQEENARDTFEALFCYMGEEFGDYKERVSNWVLGNEVNSCNAWNFSGHMSLQDCVANYAEAFQVLSQGVHRTVSSSRVFISLDHCWNASDAGHSGKAFLDEFAAYMNRTAPSMKWNVNYHPYSNPLNRSAFWSDYSSTADSVDTRYISMRNFQVLTDYLWTLETKYGKEVGSTRVIIGELGYSARGGDSGAQKLQAAALGYGYYKAMFNTRVDAYIIRAYLDAPEETRAGLYLGLRNADGSQTEKEAYTVYKNLDTSRSLEYMNQYLGTVGISNWSGTIPGFDASKLEARDF